jgi:anionic cell wall polymer biosynthesis LytR-Cps2A-Psr (LCP) family protein
VEVDVETDLKYVDKAGGLKIDITAGKQVLNGENAEGYVRFRNDGKGDIGRIYRQQKFMKAFMKKISSLKELSWENLQMLGRLPGFITDLFQDIDTDMPLKLFMKIFVGFSDMKKTSLKNAMLEGEGEYIYDFELKKKINYFISNTEQKTKSRNWLLFPDTSEPREESGEPTPAVTGSTGQTHETTGK